MTTRYITYNDGPPTPEVLPTYAPCGADGSECHLVRHGFRTRKTGPEHPLVVLRCQTHAQFWTLYPLGFSPWGRAPLAPAEAGASSPSPWRPTYFRAAVEAASGQPAWPREGQPGELRWWTQVRHIRRAADWLGLEGDARLSEEIGAVIGAQARAMQQARQRYTAARGFRERGYAVSAVLEEIPLDPRTLERVLRAGQVGGQCGRAWRCRADGSLAPPFRPVGTGGQRGATG